VPHTPCRRSQFWIPPSIESPPFLENTKTQSPTFLLYYSLPLIALAFSLKSIL
jgi:hypothetical protein